MERVADFGCERTRPERDKKKISYLMNEWRSHRKPSEKRHTVYYGGKTRKASSS